MFEKFEKFSTFKKVQKSSRLFGSKELEVAGSYRRSDEEMKGIERKEGINLKITHELA